MGLVRLKRISISRELKMKTPLVLFLFLALNVNLAQSNYSNSYISPPSSLLDGIEPRAKWIWDNGIPNPPDYHLLLRKTFNLSDTAEKASAFISAYSFADIYINGKLLDHCPVNCDPYYQVYEKFDIAKFLQPGHNVISAHVYNYDLGMHHRIEARAGFFLQCKIELPGGSELEILSDDTWLVKHAEAWKFTGKLRTGNGENRPNLIGYNEDFIASLMPNGWNEIKFDVSGWANAFEIGIPPIEPWNEIVTINRPALHKEETFPVKSWRNGDKIIYDFGKEITASPYFEIYSAEEDIRFEIGTGERLDADNNVIATKRVDFTDHYTTRSGDQSWSPITWRGFRYLYIEANNKVTIRKVSALARNYDLTEEGNFECSDSLLNKIWETGKYTVKLCSQDTYMDTPWREQTQYIAGDSRYLQKYAFYAFGGSSNFLTKYNILSGAESQRWSSEGAIRSRYPTGWLLGKNTSAYLPDYELEWIIMLGEYYQYFGDENLIKQVYPNMKKLLTYLGSFVSAEHGLIKDAPGWIVLDHPDTYPMDQKEEITGLNCLYYQALKQAALLAKSVLLNESDNSSWNSKAEELRININKWLFDPVNKLYRDSFGSEKFSQQTQVYALLYDLPDNSLKENIIQHITGLGRNSEQSFAYYVLYSVFDQKPEWAVNYIKKYWGEQMQSPLFNGAWHEAWDIASWKSDFGSTSHAWCSGPTALLPQKILGTEPIEPGWKLFSIKPHSAGLKWAKGMIPSPRGKIKIGWKKLKGEFLLEVIVPDNTEALVNIPSAKEGNITINGMPIFTDSVKYSESIAIFKLRPGEYSIISKL